MSEQHDLTDEPTDEVGAERPEPTGVERVDAVLDDIAGLGDQPVAEHVAVFERVHTELRSALDPH